MKNPLFTVLLLALVALPVAAQYGRGSYVAPVAPQRTITTYTYSPGVGSYNYNSYKPSYSPAPSYRPSETPAPRSSYSSGRDTESSRPESRPTALPATHWLEKMDEAYFMDFSGIIRLGKNVNPAELNVDDRGRYYQYIQHCNHAITDYPAATAAYEECLSKYPESVTSYMHFEASENYYRRGNRGDHQLGVAAYGRSNPVYKLNDYYRNLSLISLDQHSAAYANLAAHGEAFYKSYDVEPADYHYLLAECALTGPIPAADRAARYQAAVSSLTRYLELRGDNPQNAYLYRARAYYVLGDYPQCIADATLQLQRNPRNQQALARRADAYTAQLKYREALLDRNLALGFDGNAATNWDARGWTRCLSGDFAGGLADAREALRRDSTSVLASRFFSTRGYARFGLGQYAAAANDYTRGAALYPAAGLACLMRGKCRLKINEKSLARADFAQAAKLGVEGHPTLTTADARKLLALAGGSAAPAGKKPAAPARPAAKARR